MNTDYGSIGIQLRNFQSFFNEVIRIKQIIKKQQLPEKKHAGDEVSAKSFLTASEVSNTLSSLLEIQEMEVKQRGIINEIELYQKAQLAMAALADEIFMFDVSWAQKENWNNHLIETALFRTRMAGEKVYVDLDDLMDVRVPNRTHVDLAIIYLFTLRLGFLGKYRSIKTFGESSHEGIELQKYHENLISRYRNNLTTWIRESNARFGDESLPMFIDSYEHTLSEGSETKLSLRQSQTNILLLIILGYLGTTYFIWEKFTEPLQLLLNAGLGGTP